MQEMQKTIDDKEDQLREFIKEFHIQTKVTLHLLTNLVKLDRLILLKFWELEFFHVY